MIRDATYVGQHVRLIRATVVRDVKGRRHELRAGANASVTHLDRTRARCFFPSFVQVDAWLPLTAIEPVEATP